MLNKIWAFLVVAGVFYGIGAAINNFERGKPVTKTVNGVTVTEYQPYKDSAERLTAFGDMGKRLTEAAINSAAYEYTDPDTKAKKSGALGIVVGLLGGMMVWLGFMRIAEQAGLVQILARAIAPLFRWLFPRVPVEHPAAGSVMMNITANLLGLDNAATPMGIKAMKELQELNGRKDTATNAMCMFLAMNASGLTLIPMTVIIYRMGAHSINAMTVLPYILFATFCGKVVAIASCKIAERFSPEPPMATPEQQAAAAAEART